MQKKFSASLVKVLVPTLKWTARLNQKHGLSLWKEEDYKASSLVMIRAKVPTGDLSNYKENLLGNWWFHYHQGSFDFEEGELLYTFYSGRRFHCHCHQSHEGNQRKTLEGAEISYSCSLPVCSESSFQKVARTREGNHAHYYAASSSLSRMMGLYLGHRRTEHEVYSY